MNITISTYFENRAWKNGEAEKVARSQRYWAIQRRRVSRALDKKEREKK